MNLNASTHHNFTYVKKYIYNLHDFCTCRYTLLVGKPPFETSCLKDTYMKIKKNEYHVPSRVSLPAKNLIMKLLKGDPTDRPNMDTLLEEEFFHTGKKQNDAGYNIVIYKKVLQFVTEYSSPCLKFLKTFFFFCRLSPPSPSHQLSDHGPQVWHPCPLGGPVSTTAPGNQQSWWDLLDIIDILLSWFSHCLEDWIVRITIEHDIYVFFSRWKLKTPDCTNRH